MKINRGDIWLVDFGPQEGSDDHLQHGIRPVIIVSNDKANAHSPVIHCVPLTSKIQKKSYLPTHVFINGYQATGLLSHSIAQCEQLQAVNFTSMMKKIGKVSSYQLARVEAGILNQLAI